MDRKTFSSYGGLIAIVIVIAIMISFASPFAQFIVEGIKTPMLDLKGVTDKVFDLGGSGSGSTEVVMLDGDGQVFFTALPEDLSFRSSANVDDLVEVQVNGETVDPSNYTVTSGSTIITLHKAYLATLPVEVHNITVVSTSGSATASFSVMESAQLNEYGFYYNQPYQMNAEGDLIEFVCYDDGSASLWLGDAYGGYYPATSVALNTNMITLTEEDSSTTVLTASADGTTLSAGDMTLTLSMVTPGSIQTGASYGAHPNIGPLVFVFEADGSIGAYISGVLDSTIPADVVEYFDHYFVVHDSEDMICPIYPDGSKVMINGMVCTTCLHDSVETRDIAPTCAAGGVTNAKVCTACGSIVENGTVVPATGNHTPGGDGICSTCNGWIVPTGGTYYVGVTSTTTGDYTGATAIYTAGQFVYGVNTGDVFLLDNYEYKYNWGCGGSYAKEWTDDTVSGWGVRYLGNESAPADILESINGKPVTHMGYTFHGCTSLTTAPAIPSSVTKMAGTFHGCTSLAAAPAIPSSVTNMFNTFNGCTSLATAPTIPSSVTIMSYTFSGCTSLTGNVEIHADPNKYSYDGCFYNTTKAITITGSCSDATKAALAGTSNNGNVSY